MFLPLTNAAGGPITINVKTVVAIRPDFNGNLAVDLVDGQTVDLLADQAQRLLDALGLAPGPEENIQEVAG